MAKTVWITGGTSGLGAALALAHAWQGWQVIVSGRNVEKLDYFEKQNPAISAKQLDVTNQQQCVEVIHAIIRDHSLDRVILNAGTCEYIDHGMVNSNTVKSVFDTNFYGVVNCLQPLIEQYAKQPLQIAVIGSISSLLPMPRAEAYGASKAALDYLVESLRSSLFYTRIKLSLVQPGFIKTPLTDKNDFPMPGIISADKAANKIMIGLDKQQPVIRFPKRLYWPMLLLAKLPVVFRSKLLQGLTSKNSEDSARERSQKT